MNTNKKRLSRRSGQTMVEYIIIVVLIAISLIVVVGKFGKALGIKWAGATSAIDEQTGQEAADEVEDTSDKIKTLQPDGSFD